MNLEKKLDRLLEKIEVESSEREFSTTEREFFKVMKEYRQKLLNSISLKNHISLYYEYLDKYINLLEGI